MCSPARCRKCGKTTWKGCGLHVDRVMARVPEDQRCPGHEPDPEPRRSWFTRRKN